MRHAATVLFVVAAVGLVAARAAGWATYSWLEMVGVITGAACVLLVVRRHIWNFPAGIVSCAAYLVLFAEGRFFAEAGLQVVFIALGVHGWVAWARGHATAVPVRRVPLGEMTALATAIPAVWLALTRLLEHVKGTAPVYDAFIFTLSLAAQWLLNRRYVESWLGWIVVDQVAVVLFVTRELYLTAGLYALFLGMCVAGLIEWRRDLGEGGR